MAMTRANSSQITYTPAGTGAVVATAQSKLREFVSVKDFGAVGDGVADDTAAITTAIASNPKGLIFPAGTYLTTGFVIPADSNIGEIVGIGRPTLRRQGQGVVATGVNLTIIAVYKNRLKISGFNIDGRGQSFAVPPVPSTIPPDRTWYADIAVLTAQGSPDPTQYTDNFCLITDCYFYDAPGTSVAGSQMQNCIVTGCKFDGWLDHAVYASGGTAVSNDIIVSNNIFTQARYNGGFAVKLRNRVSRYVVSNNTFDMGAVPPSVTSNGAIVFDQGNDAPASNYKPTSMVISGNAGKTGIFFSMNTEFTVQNPGAISTVQITGNNIRSDTDLFYIADTAGGAWAAHMNIVGNSFYNEAGVWKVLLDFRFVNSTYGNTVVFSENMVFDYGLMQVANVYPQTTRILNNRFNRSFARFVESLGTDDATAKVLEFRGNHFVHDTNTSKGQMVLRSGENSTLVFRDNFFKNNASLSIQSQPRRIEAIGNVFEDSTGFDFGATFAALAARGTAGEIFIERNKAISTIGASTVPRLLAENVNTPNQAILNSYNLYLNDNYFEDVTGGVSLQGTAVTGYAGANRLYAFNNHGIGFTFNAQYPNTRQIDSLPSTQLNSGTFTPVVVGGTVAGTGTYTTQIGQYWREGRVVHFELVVIWTAHTGTGALRVTGLPFNSSNGGGSLVRPLRLAYQNLTYTAGSTVYAGLADNGNLIFINEVAPGGAAANVAIDTAATLWISGSYISA